MAATVKKFVFIGVCITLIIISAVISPGGANAYGGRGTGAGAQISKLEDFQQFLESSGGSDLYSSYALGSSTQKYTSYTYTEKSKVYATTSQNTYGSGSYSSTSSSNFSLERTLTVYRTDYQVLYESVGRLSEKETSRTNYYYSSSSDRSSQKDIKESSSEAFNVKVYMNMKTSRVLLYFTDLTYTYSYDKTDTSAPNNDVHKTEADADEVLTVLKNYSYRWIDLSSQPEIALEFLEIDESNLMYQFKLESLIRRQLNADSDDKPFYESGNVYTMKSTYLKSLLETDMVKGNYVVDLSNKKNPTVEWNVKMDVSLSVSGQSASSYAFAEVSENYRDINNTVIRIGKVKSVDLEEILEKAGK